MKPINSIILLVVMTALCLSTGVAQQSSAKKAPLLTSEDLTAPSNSGVNSSPALKSITGDSVKWQRYSPGELALSIELPGKPIPLGLTVPNAAAQHLSPAKAYSYESKEISVFVFRFSVNKLPVSATDLRTFGSGFLDAPSKNPGVNDVDNQTKVENDSTVLLRGSYRVGGIVFATRGFVHTSGRNVWLIATRFLQDDEQANALSLRIISSVKID